jgi:hypothetical protein
MYKTRKKKRKKTDPKQKMRNETGCYIKKKRKEKKP